MITWPDRNFVNDYPKKGHTLLQIAEILPREKQGILACFSYEPILVKQNLQGLHKLIKRARETPIKQNDASQLIQIESRPLETAVEGNFFYFFFSRIPQIVRFLLLLFRRNGQSEGNLVF